MSGTGTVQRRPRAASALVFCAAIAAVAAATTQAFVVTPVARAATYDVWSCRGPDGAAIGTDAWSRPRDGGDPGDVELGDTCAGGAEGDGALTIALARTDEVAGGTRGELTFAAPPDTRIADYELWRSLQVAPSERPKRFDFAAVVAEQPESGPLRAYGCTSSGPCTSEGDPSRPLSPANHFTAQEPPLDAVSLIVECTSPEACDGPADVAARVALFRARVALEDSTPPDAPTTSGTLTDPGPVPDSASITVAGADRGGGVASVSLSIDGGAAEVRRSTGTGSTCHEPYAVAQPCPGDVSPTFAVDTTTLSAGEHRAGGTIVDAAGNATAWGPLSFTVARAPAAPPATPSPSGNGTPAVDRPRLRLARADVTHAPGRRVVLSGTLRTPGGTAIAGARLAVASRDVGVSRDVTRRLPAVTTDSTGRFRLTLRRDGSQRVSLTFAPRAGAEPTAQVVATVRTRLGVALSAPTRRLHKGQQLTLLGRLRGAGPSAAGRVVEIQSVLGGRWSPVAAVRAAADGRYRWSHRFVRLAQSTLFSFRAVVRGGPGWPWPTVVSASVRTRVDVP